MFFASSKPRSRRVLIINKYVIVKFLGLQIDKAARWGDLESDEEESSEEEESEQEDEEAAGREDDEASLADGLASVGGVSSLPSGLETPEVIDLRKAKAGGKLTSQLMCTVTTHLFVDQFVN